ncbi:hypothetical protein TD95_003695 [Thielaviopsis punctulata]|uniref:DUF159 domain protein n=1 Tax=Thielaviopsis punctulata TaxID=72032 RepID=A0A0F4ZBW5_9PEZI|nr:hypothetical protein TD95_003695 [Thielaviopsis punctulata]
MSVAEVPSDDGPEAPTSTNNFAPGNTGIVFRAETPSDPKTSESYEQHYKLQSMKWGLVPSWMKRQPDYKFIMRTINCRAESLAEPSGMWSSMKTYKRCVVPVQGFFEWLHKGKDKIPHFVKRPDGKLLYLAGLWDRVVYENTDNSHVAAVYTYTIVTTQVNAQLEFLHARMPVILEPGSAAMRAWLDPQATQWGEKLQNVLVPFPGALEAYTVTRDVGKVGTDSPMYVVPVNSKENKGNIANFLQTDKKVIKKQGTKVEAGEGPQCDGSTAAVKSENNDTKPVMASTHKRTLSNEVTLPASKKQAISRLPQKRGISATHNRPRPGVKPSKGTNNAKITNFFSKT